MNEFVRGRVHRRGRARHSSRCETANGPAPITFFEITTAAFGLRAHGGRHRPMLEVAWR
jgi:hypothetical protein